MKNNLYYILLATSVLVGCGPRPMAMHSSNLDEPIYYAYYPGDTIGYKVLAACDVRIIHFQQ